jgi:antitoxin component of RelBE/YafQ-DinJ toxin-antitoxin module
MKTDTEIKEEALRILIEKLGILDTERFINILLKEPFDYTKWQRNLWEGKSIREISKDAMDYNKSNKGKSV